MTGALEDTRSPEAKAKDFQFKEIVAGAAPVTWTEKPADQIRLFSKRYQDGSMSCVEQSVAKLGEILYFLKTGQKIPFSAAFYKLRSNFPAPGMIGVDALEMWRKQGIPLEALVGSQNMNDAALDGIEITPAMKDVAAIFKIGNYFQYTPKTDFEAIASTIQFTGKGVMVWFEFSYQEWTEDPFIMPNTTPSIRHSTVAVDITLRNGKKCLVIEDSVPYNGVSTRYISEEFFAARNLFAAYPINLQSVPEAIEKPQGVSFNVDMQLGDTNDSVKKLQQALQTEGLFPTNVQLTGYFGALTQQAVQKFQVKYGIASPGQAGYGRVGPNTRAKLNALFN